jgi:hypothetical protein
LQALEARKFDPTQQNADPARELQRLYWVMSPRFTNDIDAGTKAIVTGRIGSQP